MNANSTFTYGQIAQAIEHLTAHFREQPSLTDLAERANLSEFHFQRLFTEWAGVSPKKFGQYLTLEHAKGQLRRGVPLTEAAYDAGLSGTAGCTICSSASRALRRGSSNRPVRG